MTDLAIVSENPEGLIIPHNITFDQWWKFRETLYRYKLAQEKLDVCMTLHTMDWVFGGEAKFGEDASQALAFAQDEMGWSAGTASEYHRVWERFKPENRYPGLGISMYQAVMGLPPQTAHGLLELASRENWTREQLRKAVKHNEPEGSDEPKVTRKDIERAAIGLLRNLKPAGDHYEAEYDPANELALLLDFPLVELVVSVEQVEGQVSFDD